MEQFSPVESIVFTNVNKKPMRLSAGSDTTIIIVEKVWKKKIYPVLEYIGATPKKTTGKCIIAGKKESKENVIKSKLSIEK